MGSELRILPRLWTIQFLDGPGSVVSLRFICRRLQVHNMEQRGLAIRYGTACATLNGD